MAPEGAMTSRVGYFGLGRVGTEGERRRLPKRLGAWRRGERSARRCFIEPEGEDVDFWRSREGVETERGRGMRSGVEGEKAVSKRSSGEVCTLRGLFQTED